MCRASQGFIRRLNIDIEEEIVPRDFRYWLRLVADWTRSPLWAISRSSYGPTSTRMINVDSDGEVSLEVTHEAALRRENHHGLMRDFYREIEPTLIANGDLEDQTDTLNNRTQPSASDVPEDTREPRRQQLLRELPIARRSFRNAHDELDTLGGRYKDQLEGYNMTYRIEPELDEDPEDQSPDNAFDREFMANTWNANRAIRTAEAQIRSLRNEALELKVADPQEPGLLGVLDHPDDGFAQSNGSTWRLKDDLVAAENWPGIHHWLQTAAGSPSEHVKAPSEVANIEVGDSVRSAMSCLEPSTMPAGFIDRWTAEMVVTRAEAEEKWLEHYRALGKDPPRGIYLVELMNVETRTKFAKQRP